MTQDELQFQELIDGLKVGVLVQGPQAEILVSNQTALDLLGLTKDQLLGKSSFDPTWNVIHEDGLPFPGATHPVPAAISTRQPVRNVVMGVYRPKLDDRAWLLVNAEPRFNADSSLRDVICTFSDITERKQIEATLQTIIDTIPDSIARVNADGTILYFQPAQGAVLTPEDVIGQSITQFLTPSQSDEFRALIHTAIATNRVQAWEYQSSTRGRPRNWEMRIVAMAGNEALIITRDVTPERQHALDLMEIERGQMLKDFIDNIAHDLRTPLSILNTSLYLMRRLVEGLVTEGTSLDSDAATTQVRANQIYERLATMDDNINRLTRIIDAMFEVTHFDQDHVYQLEPHDLNQLAQQAYDNLLTLAQTKQIALTLELLPSAVPVLMDSFSLIYALKHVLENAIQYTASAGEVTVQVYQRQHEAIFEVRDTGIGISQADLPHIFERFYRADKARDFSEDSYGLGLSIAKEIVAAHHGSIEVESEPGRGSLFRIGLPSAS